MNPTEPRGREIRLDHMRVATQPIMIGAEVRDKTKLNVEHLVELDKLKVWLETYVLREHLADANRTFYFHWPASAWQGWKQRHPWVAKLLPVKEMHASATVEVTSWATYPEANFVTELGRPVIMQEMRTLSELDGYRVDR